MAKFINLGLAGGRRLGAVPCLALWDWGWRHAVNGTTLLKTCMHLDIRKYDTKVLAGACIKWYINFALQNKVSWIADHKT